MSYSPYSKFQLQPINSFSANLTKLQPKKPKQSSFNRSLEVKIHSDDINIFISCININTTFTKYQKFFVLYKLYNLYCNCLQMRLSPSDNSQINAVQLIQNIQMRQTTNNSMFSQINIDLTKSANVEYNKTKTNTLQNYLIHNKSIEEMSKSIYRGNTNEDFFLSLKSSQESLINERPKQTNLIKIYRQESIKSHLNGKRKNRQENLINSRTIFNDTLIKKTKEFSFQRPINLLPEISRYDQNKERTENMRNQIRNSGNVVNLITISHIQNPQVKKEVKKTTIIDLIDKKHKNNRINKMQQHFQMEKERLLNEELKRKKSNQRLKKNNLQFQTKQRKYQSLEISPLRQDNNFREPKAQTIQIRITRRQFADHNAFNPRVNKINKKSRNSYSPWNYFRESKDAWTFQY